MFFKLFNQFLAFFFEVTLGKDFCQFYPQQRIKIPYLKIVLKEKVKT